MSTGVYRSWPYSRQGKAPFTPGQSLDAPIPSAFVDEAVYLRESRMPTVIKAGIAALLPVANTYVPPPPVVVQQVRPQVVIQAPARFTIAQPLDAPIPTVTVVDEACYLRPGLLPTVIGFGPAALIPVQSYVPPAVTVLPQARIAAQVLQPEPGIAVFFPQSLDYVQPQYVTVPMRREVAGIEQVAPGIAPLIATAVSYVPPALVNLPARQPYPVPEVISAGLAWLPTNLYVPPAPVLSVPSRSYPAPQLRQYVTAGQPLAGWIPPYRVPGATYIRQPWIRPQGPIFSAAFYASPAIVGRIRFEAEALQVKFIAKANDTHFTAASLRTNFTVH